MRYPSISSWVRVLRQALYLSKAKSKQQWHWQTETQKPIYFEQTNDQPNILTYLAFYTYD